MRKFAVLGLLSLALCLACVGESKANGGLGFFATDPGCAAPVTPAFFVRQSFVAQTLVPVQPFFVQRSLFNLSIGVGRFFNPNFGNRFFAPAFRGQNRGRINGNNNGRFIR